MSAPLSEVKLFREAVARVMGLRFDDDRLPWLEELLVARAKACGVNAATYCSEHLATPLEIAALARSLSVNETYFLRNRDQFTALASLLRQRGESGARSLRILSAGCSSGEEAYSLAIVARENLTDLAAWSLSIVGFDFHPDVVEKARTGRYTSWSLRETPEEMQRQYLHLESGHYRVSADVAKMVQFEVRSLMDADPLFWRPGSFDVIFCRNVLMYFTPEAMRTVVARFAEALRPDGHLFLGHAENLRGVSRDFRLCHTHGTFYYQRRTEQSPEPHLYSSAVPVTPSHTTHAPHDVGWFGAIARSSERIETLARGQRTPSRPSVVPVARRDTGTTLAPILGLLGQERFREALSLLGDLDQAARQSPDALLLKSMLLLGSGDLETAEHLCGELLALDDLSAGAHYVKALCREHAGDASAALQHDRLAIYLEPDFAMPHLHAGLLARRTGDTDTARRELARAEALFAREDTGRILLFGGGFGREALVGLCRAELTRVGGAP